VGIPVRTDFLEKLERVRLWDGSPLPPGLRTRLGREYAGLEFVRQQITELDAERGELIRTSDDPSVEKVRQLLCLRGIGGSSAWLSDLKLSQHSSIPRRTPVFSYSLLP
jgi:hypothetical protein